MTPTPTDVGTLSGPELDAAVWAALGYPVLRTWAAGAFYEDAKRLAKAAGKDRVYVLDNGVGHFWFPFSEFKPATIANVSSDANAMTMLIAAMRAKGYRWGGNHNRFGPGFVAGFAHENDYGTVADATADTLETATARAAIKALAAGGGK